MTTVPVANDYASQDPFTPVKPIHRDSRLQSSPFSDYFTDDGRGLDDSSSAPSPEKRQLLVRLNSLQSQLMHGDAEAERQTMDIVQRKMHEIESLINALHSQTRMPPEMEDSGLFMEDDEEDGETDERKYKVDSRLMSPTDQATAEQKQAESDFLLLESQRVLESVSKANEQLRQRLADTNLLHEQLASKLEARDQEIAALRAENESVNTDLALDHSELLFLQLQFKALEVGIASLDDGAQRLESYAPEIKEDIQRVKRQRIAEEMNKWRHDWEVIDARMEKRRRRYRAESDVNENQATLDGSDAWWLQTVMEEGGDGKVHSLTIQRVANEDAKEYADCQTGGDGIEANSQQSTSSQSPAKYVDVSTQTAHAHRDLFLDGEYAAEDGIEEFDCAITTSSEDNTSVLSDGEDDFERRGRIAIKPSLTKTAWQELWEGLAGFAGMGEGTLG